MKYSKEKNTGITLIALVVTIIILLILAGVTIATLTGDNGLLQKASTAKQTSKEAEIKEKIILVVNSARMKNMSLLDRTILEDELKNEFGEGNYELLLVGESFLISVNKIEYFVEKDGKVSDGNKVEESNIKYAGDLSKGGEYNGDTEETAYRITCIEDLVEWSNNYNNYKNKNIKLEKTIDFNSTASYNNPRAKTTDINENGKIEELITELTTGTGFKPILRFSGIFDGQNNEIRNIYENKIGDAGLFNSTPTATIKRVNITGKFIATENIAAISCSGDNATIIDCSSNCNINAGKNASGIFGKNGSSSSGVYIYNCFTKGTITGHEYAGGICSYLTGSNKIINCYNEASVEGNSAGGILGGIYMGMVLTTDNCLNYGDLKGIDYTGGISGYSFAWRNPAGTVENAYYLDSTASYGYKYNPDPSNGVNKQYMQRQEFVDELNIYVNTYNEEHKNDEDFVSLKRWKYNQGDYPLFE